MRAYEFYASAVVICSLLLLFSVYSINKSNLKQPVYLSSRNSPTLLPIQTYEIKYIVITETPIPTPTRRPTLTPTKTPIPISSGELESLMEKYANKESVNKELLKRIARCESRFNTRAVNGPYGGLYQFSTSSWISSRTAMNENPDPELRFNAEEAIKTAAYKIASGHTGIWPNCSK